VGDVGASGSNNAAAPCGRLCEAESQGAIKESARDGNILARASISDMNCPLKFLACLSPRKRGEGEVKLVILERASAARPFGDPA
jgi:hypothetical protein